MGRSPAAVVAALVVTLLAGVAYAHPLVDEGRRLYGQADFTGALRAYGAAEAADDLERQELIDLLEGRALCHFALDARAEFERDLRALASVDPAHQFAGDIPPEVRNAFATTRRSNGGERIRLVVDREDAPGGVSLVAHVRGDVAELVREVIITARVGDAPWEPGSGGILRLDTTPGVRVEYFAVAKGPGGAPLALLGSVREPRTFTIGGGAPLDGAGEPRDDDGGGWSAWAVIGVIAGVIVVAGVIAGVILATAGESTQTDLEGPFLVRM